MEPEAFNLLLRRLMPHFDRVDTGEGYTRLHNFGVCTGTPFCSFRSRPLPTLAVHGRFLTVVCLLIVSGFPSTSFLCVFPGFTAKPFRGMGVGFEEPHIRLCSSYWNRDFREFPIFLHMRLIGVG